MTESQVSQKDESEIVRKKKRPLWRWLVLFGVAPLALVALTIAGYVQLARAQDHKRVVSQLPRVSYLVDNSGLDSNPNAPMATSANQWSQPGQPQPNFSNSANSPQGTPRGPGYVAETTVEYAAVTDPNTGITQYRPQTRTNYRQVQSGNLLGANGNQPPQAQSFNDTRIHQLVNELRATQNEGVDQSRPLAELQRMLDDEFGRMHKRQADEIEATEKRLANLKKLHEERGNNRSQIVQRRIDQLTGKSNPLDWDMNPSVSLPSSITQGFAAPGFTTPGFTGPPISTLPQTNSLQSPPARIFEQDPLPPGALLVPRNDAPRPSLPTLGSVQPGYTTPPVTNSLSTTSAGAFSELRQVEVSPSYPTNDANSRGESSLNQLNELFAVIRSAGEARLAEQSNAVLLKSYSELHKQGAIPWAELQKVQLEFDSASQRKTIAEAQLKAFKRTLQYEVDASITRLRDAQQALESTSTEADKTAARAELSKLQEAHKSRQVLLSQFDDAMELLKDQDTSEPAPSATIEPTIEPTTEADEETDEETDTLNQEPIPTRQVEPAEDIAP